MTNKIWQEAITDPHGILLHELSNTSIQYVISRGIKIEKKENKFYLYNINGYFWVKLTKDERNIIRKDGWVNGTISISLSKLTSDLDTIEKSIRNSTNSNKRNTHITSLKREREEGISIYSNLIKQIR